MSLIPEKKIHQLAALIGSLVTIVTAIVLLGNMQWQTRKDADALEKAVDARMQSLRDSIFVLRSDINIMKTVAKSKSKGRVR